MYPTKEAIVFLNRELHLPATGHEQDWDIELADPNRVDEFVAFSEGHDSLDEEIKLALMALILGSLEEMGCEHDLLPVLSDRVKRLLRSNLALYTDLLRYWTQSGPTGDDFLIAPLLRSI